MQLRSQGHQQPPEAGRTATAICPGQHLGRSVLPPPFSLALWPPGFWNHERICFRDFRPPLVVMLLCFASPPSFPPFPFSLTLLPFCLLSLLNNNLRKQIQSRNQNTGRLLRAQCHQPGNVQKLEEGNSPGAGDTVLSEPRIQK